jgi:hypothetical protein
MEQAEFRARLEAQAAGIVGRARAEAGELLRTAEVDAAEVVRVARTSAADLEAVAHDRVRAATHEVDALREQAHRELVQAQERALLIRADAQRTADGIIERATLRARTEADELLREAQRQLARAVDEKQAATARIEEAQVRIEAAQSAERRAADAVELVAMAAAEAVAQAAAEATVSMSEQPDLMGAYAAAIDLTRSRSPERDRFIVTMHGETFDDLLAGAIRAAVRRAFNPLVRGGHHIEPRVLQSQDRR